jgi:NADPH-dependent glutamate synthase beta subunit-like oxidoreductase/2,4-dienoyl-CoA reductase-like NADH-dependent reductase (Old Yellow Enzyme family)
MTEHEQFHFHSPDEVRRRIAELGLDLELSDDLRPLLEPVKAGKFKLPNRMVVLPMEGCDGTADGTPDELTFRRYRRFAAGGAGLLWVEATAVVPEGRANPRQLWLHKKNVAAFKQLVGEARKAAREACGAKHRPMLIVQLTHSGRYSRPVNKPQPIIAHHSRFLDPTHNLPPAYPLITDEELARLEDRYVEAALCAQRAGFDGVDVKACHRYLVSELLASHTRQDSRYGGSFENRSRFLRNVVAKIRAAAPKLLVTARLNAYDAMAYPYGFGVDQTDPNKPDLAEPIEIVRFLRSQGAPLVNITIGNPYYNPYVNRPFDLPTAGAALPPESPLVGVARFVHIVREVQAAVPEMLVVGGGHSWLRQFFPHLGAASVHKGWVSLVGVGRMAFAYPDFARELKERGQLDPLKVCVTCSACTQIMRDGGRAGCVPRDGEVYEPIYKQGRAEAMDTIIQMAKTCRQCNDPTCVSGCPARVNIPKFVGLVAAGKFREAYEALREANALAAVCGYVCPSETQCEAHCNKRRYSFPVPIRHLQRWVARKAVEEGWVAAPHTESAPTEKKVAVIGAGPAGVAAAAKLASLGHAVTLFDRSAAPGGAAQDTIPADRLPDPILRQEIQDVLASSGNVTRRYNAALDRNFNLDRLMAEGYHAALLAIGLGKSTPLPGAMRPKSGVVSALEFLARAKKGVTASGTVLVLGGGNTAIDAALAARHAGADQVSVVYRRSFAEMPAWPHERDEAVGAGINLLTLTAPLDYVADARGRLTGLKVVRTKLGRPDASGRRAPKPIPGSEHVLPADLVIEALGQQLDDALKPALSGVRLTKDGLVWVHEDTLETSRPGVFAAGDLVNGGTTVVQAVAEGARAARQIDEFLSAEPVAVRVQAGAKQRA